MVCLFLSATCDYPNVTQGLDHSPSPFSQIRLGEVEQFNVTNDRGVDLQMKSTAIFEAIVNLASNMSGSDYIINLVDRPTHN